MIVRLATLPFGWIRQGLWLLTTLASLAAIPVSARTVLITGADVAAPMSGPAATLRVFHLRGNDPTAPAAAVMLPPAGQPVQAGKPFELRIDFTTPSDASIEPSAVRLFYVHGVPIDITSRVSRFITPQGLDIRDAVAAPGNHLLRLVLTDDQGIEATTEFTLNVRN